MYFSLFGKKSYSVGMRTESKLGPKELVFNSGNKLEGDAEDIVSLQAQTFPYFHLREKFKCKEHIDKGATQLKTSP